MLSETNRERSEALGLKKNNSQSTWRCCPNSIFLSARQMLFSFCWVWSLLLLMRWCVVCVWASRYCFIPLSLWRWNNDGQHGFYLRRDGTRNEWFTSVGFHLPAISMTSEAFVTWVVEIQGPQRKQKNAGIYSNKCYNIAGQHLVLSFRMAIKEHIM